MLVLRADPWMPTHGMGFEVPVEDEEDHAEAAPFVEREDWSRAVDAVPAEPGPTWFVDGVRRVEVRLLADQDGRRAPGLFGSYAVGSVCCDGRASFDRHRAGRAVVLGGGLQPERVEIAVGESSFAFDPVSEQGSDPDRPLWRLQQVMRKAEADLAAFLAGEGGRIVLVDGPLGLRDPTACPVVGVVKRHARQYLGSEQEGLVGSLRPGERTPLFGLGLPGQPVERYAWYTRLVAWRAPWHDRAGVVRCEVPAGLGLDRSVEVAGTVTGLLPSFAGRASDPRTPQNLIPVAGLEAWLRHRMGHPGIVRRALLTWLSTDAMEGVA